MLFEQIKILIRNTIKENAFPCFAKIYEVQTKEYTCHCRELTNDLEETETIYTRVQIPKLVASKEGGIFLTPNKDTLVLLNFLNGDRNYPIISAILGEENFPNSPVDKLVIKAGGKDLGEILIAMCKKISGITTAGSPTTQTLRPDQIVKWDEFVEQEIKQLFGESSPEGGDSSNPEPEPEPEKPKPDPEPEKPKPEPEPETDLFVSNKYRDNALVPVGDLIKQMNTEVYESIKAVAEKVRIEMGDKFESIKINSAFRTGEEQANAMVALMNNGENIYTYYNTAGLSRPYLRIIQNRYDGKKDNDFESITIAYNSSSYKDWNGAKRAMIFEHILKEYPIVEKNLDSVKKVFLECLDKIHEVPSVQNSSASYDGPLFMPSRHMIRDKKYNPFSQAMDIKRTNKGTEERDTAHAVYTDYSRGKHKGKGHYHLGY